MEYHLIGNKSLKKIGFFGGTFDPIHFGHLNLAINLLEKQKLDEILFSPANFSPEKTINPPLASGEDRKEMTRLAIEEIDSCRLIDLELKREGPSYTIDTICHLKEMHPNWELHLILGEDVLPGLPNWKDILVLLELAPPLVGTRPFDKLIHLPPKLLAFIDRGRVDTPMMEISSTELRERLLQKKYCGHLIPAKVLDYIHQHGLY